MPEVQVHEPYLVTSQAHGLRADVEGAYAALAAEGVPIHPATYYDDLGGCDAQLQLYALDVLPALYGMLVFCCFSGPPGLAAMTSCWVL